MQDFNFIKQQFLSLQIPVNEHYLNRYIKFILALPELKRKDGYCEEHHILPVSLFPRYERKSVAPWNQKKIDARAHQICHWVLRRAFPSNVEMSRAFWGMSNQKKGGRTYKINSRIYAEIKAEHSDRVSGEGNPMYGRNIWECAKDIEALKIAHHIGVNTDYARRKQIEGPTLYWANESIKENKSKSMMGDNNISKLPHVRKKQSESRKKYFINNPEATKSMGKHMKDLPAWLTSRCIRSPKQLYAWSLADRIYNSWVKIDSPVSYVKLERHLDIHGKINLKNMTMKFNSGWNPNGDPIWVQRFKEGDQMTRPSGVPSIYADDPPQHHRLLYVRLLLGSR